VRLHAELCWFSWEEEPKIKHQERIKDGHHEKDTVSGPCSVDDGSFDTMCFGSSEAVGI
jgi:hypothetical protein